MNTLSGDETWSQRDTATWKDGWCDDIHTTLHINKARMGIPLGSPTAMTPRERIAAGWGTAEDFQFLNEQNRLHKQWLASAEGQAWLTTQPWYVPTAQEELLASNAYANAASTTDSQKRRHMGCAEPIPNPAMAESHLRRKPRSHRFVPRPPRFRFLDGILQRVRNLWPNGAQGSNGLQPADRTLHL